MTLEGSIYYDQPAQKTLVVRRRITFHDLQKKIYSLMRIEEHAFKLNLTLRIPIMSSASGGSIFSATRLMDDDDIEIIYNMKEEMPNFQVKIYIETEEVEQAFQPQNFRSDEANIDMNTSGNVNYSQYQNIDIGQAYEPEGYFALEYLSNLTTAGHMTTTSEREYDEEDDDDAVDDSDINLQILIPLLMSN